MLSHKGVEPVRHDTPSELRGVVLLPTPALHMPVYAPGTTVDETVYLRRWFRLLCSSTPGGPTGGQDRLVHHGYSCTMRIGRSKASVRPGVSSVPLGSTSGGLNCLPMRSTCRQCGSHA